MTDTNQFALLYLTTVRLGVIVAGVISIVCGYRLLLAGVFRIHPPDPPTQITARLTDMEFTLKSVAPGTCFALFGAALISVMIFTNSPNFERVQSVSVTSEGSGTAEEALKMRGRLIGIEQIIENAKSAERDGNREKAIAGYTRALRLIAEPLNNLAWLYHQVGREKDALPLAQLAVQFAPSDPVFEDTLRKVQTHARK